jgi:glycosidase
MKLMTKEIAEKLPKLYANENKNPEDVEIIIKYFHPFSDWTWYATEGEKQEDGTYLFYGFVRGFANEFGYFTEKELSKIIIRGLGIERDLHFGKHMISEAMEKRI